MARIKISDLPQDLKVSREEMKKVIGGVEPTTFPVIAPGTLPFFNAGKLPLGIAGFNIGNPIQYFPGNVWKS